MNRVVQVGIGMIKLKKNLILQINLSGSEKINDSHYSVIAFTEHTLGCTVSMDYLLSI